MELSPELPVLSLWRVKDPCTHQSTLERHKGKVFLPQRNEFSTLKIKWQTDLTDLQFHMWHVDFSVFLHGNFIQFNFQIWSQYLPSYPNHSMHGNKVYTPQRHVFTLSFQTHLKKQTFDPLKNSTYIGCVHLLLAALFRSHIKLPACMLWMVDPRY